MKMWWEKEEVIQLVQNEEPVERPSAANQDRFQDLLRNCRRSYQTLIIASLVAFALNAQLFSYAFSLDFFSGYSRNLTSFANKVPRLEIVACSGLRIDSSSCKFGPGHAEIQSSLEHHFSELAVIPIPSGASLTCIEKNGEPLSATRDAIDSLTVGEIVSMYRSRMQHPSYDPKHLTREIQFLPHRAPESGVVFYSTSAKCNAGEAELELHLWWHQPPLVGGSQARISANAKISTPLKVRSRARSPKSQKKIEDDVTAVEALPYFDTIKNKTPSAARVYTQNLNLEKIRKRRQSHSVLGTPAPSLAMTAIILIGLCVNLFFHVHDLANSGIDIMSKSKTSWTATMHNRGSRITSLLLVCIAPVIAAIAAGLSFSIEKNITMNVPDYTSIRGLKLIPGFTFAAEAIIVVIIIAIMSGVNGWWLHRVQKKQ